MGPPSRAGRRIRDRSLVPELVSLPGAGAWFQKVGSSAGAGREPGGDRASESAPPERQNVPGPHEQASANAKTSAVGDRIRTT
jgi:hypothetical protein